MIMDIFNSTLDISALIARDITGQLDRHEKETLENWLASSRKNQILYDRIVNSENFSKRNELYDNVDIQKRWSLIAADLDFHTKRRGITRLLQFAAAILIPLFMVVTAYWCLNYLPENEQSASVISRGTQNAILVMASGENVNLAEGENKKYIEKDGTVISKTQTELNYPEQSTQTNNETPLNTLITPCGGEYSLVLSDGTRVYLNSMSKLVFPVRFFGNKREVTLEGEAFFEVAANKSKPFIVNIKGLQVEVLGTSFNIKSYYNDNQSYTTLVEGKVKLNSGNLFSDQIVLEPNQQAVYDNSSATVDIQAVDANQIIQWTKGRYSFTDQSLYEIMKTLSRWYRFTYTFEDESLKSIKFEGGLNKYESINPILDIIGRTEKVKVLVKGDEILFSKIK